MKKTIFALIATLSIYTEVSAYSKYGHMMVARIAYEELGKTDRGRNVITHVETTLAKIPRTPERNHPMVACASFADDLRTNGFHGRNIPSQKNWHNDPTAYAPTGDYLNYNKRS